tara:strand:+ start:152 stop:322 length:171 start_codon:yes stop_codon:yes gene_type:complete
MSSKSKHIKNKNLNKNNSKKKLNSSKKLNFNEINGPKGLEPTRYGDWEKNGRCSDF